MNFTNILNDALPAGAIAAPTDYNGNVTTIDVTHPVSWINDDNKLVVVGAGTISVAATIAYAIWVAGGRAVIAPTAAALEGSLARVGRLIAHHTVLSIARSAGVQISIRSSDTITDANLNVMLGAHSAEYREAAMKLYHAILSDPATLARATTDSKYVVLSYVATAIHRIKHDGHNWLTDKTDTPRTETNRCLAVAADAKVAFGAYMRSHGHDGTHYLTDNSLSALASLLTGSVPANFSPHFMYNGANVGNQPVHEVVKLGEAACDRWPVGQLGVASLAKGCDAIGMMVTDIASKVSVSNAAAVSAAVGAVKRNICTVSRSRADFMVVKNAMTPAIVAAYGYVSNAQGLRDSLGESEALANLARAHASTAAGGAVLANRMREVKADNAAVGELIRGTFNSIAACAAGTAIVAQVAAAGPVTTRDAVEADTEYKLKEAARKANVVAAAEKVGAIDPIDLATLAGL